MSSVGMSIVELLASDADRGADGNAGFSVHPDMQTILDRTRGSMIYDREDARVFRKLYQEGSHSQDALKYKQFAFDCFCGQVVRVKRAIEAGQAPDLMGTETPYRLGYCTITLLGSQRGADAFPRADHIATMKILMSSGAPIDCSDIAGHTALHHATKSIAGPTLSLVRVLLDSGANVNKQNIYGEIPLFGAFMLGDVRLVDVMMEYGADVDLPEANGYAARQTFVNTGPVITATVTKWLRKRSGEQKPLDGKTCARCGKTDVSLKMCSKCHAVKYCSTECQKLEWPAHKQMCKPLDSTTSVIVRPTYRDLGTYSSPSDITRHIIDGPSSPPPPTHVYKAQAPRVKAGRPKAMVVKVQVPYRGTQPIMQRGPLLVYDKKRDFVCTIEASGNEDAYMRIATTVWTKGVQKAKAYFPAVLRSRDELVIKVGEVLAEQPF